MAEMEPMAVEGMEGIQESSTEMDLETLQEAEAIKADPARMDAVKALAAEQGVDLPGITPRKSFKDSIKGIGTSLGDGLK